MLICDQVSRKRDHQLVFKPMSFQLRPGQCYHIDGPNGSGKTTFLRIVAGLSSYVGQVELQFNKTAMSSTKRIPAFLGHHHGLYSEITVGQNLQMMAKWYHVKIDAFIQSDIYQQWCRDLPLNKNVQELSAGQKQRLAWLRVHMSGSPLWLLDEPLSHLDDQTQALTRSTTENHLSNGGGVLLVTHRAEYWQSIINARHLCQPHTGRL